MPVPLDEYPVHQVPLSMRAHGDERPQRLRPLLPQRPRPDRARSSSSPAWASIPTSASSTPTPRSGAVTDSTSVRTSDALGDDRMVQQRRPLPDRGARAAGAAARRRARPRHGVAFDLTWTGSFPVVEEPRPRHAPGRARHPRRPALRPGGDVVGRPRRSAVTRLAVTDDRWVGTRDRSWGIRPVGEPEPPGRAAAEPDDGLRVLVDLRPPALRGLRHRRHRPGGRRRDPHPERGGPGLARRLGPAARATGLARGSRSATARAPATPRAPSCTCATRGGRPLDARDRDPRLRGPQLRAGLRRRPRLGTRAVAGPGLDRERRLDMNDPAMAGRIPFGVVDHVARAVVRRGRGMGDVRARDLRPPRAVGLHRLRIGGPVT